MNVQDATNGMKFYFYEIGFDYKCITINVDKAAIYISENEMINPKSR